MIKENYDELIIKTCKEEKTMSNACKKIGLKYSTFKRKAIKLNVWNPNQGAKGTVKRLYTLNDVLTNKIYIKSGTLRILLIREGYKEYKCEKCHLTKWNNMEIVLQLHHVNGNKKDNKLINLQLLCPNCHSQTDTFCGRKRKLMPR